MPELENLAPQVPNLENLTPQVPDMSQLDSDDIKQPSENVDYLSDEINNVIDDIEDLIVKPPPMKNTSNICWANSILQILFSITNFRTSVLQNNGVTSCSCDNDKFCLLCIIENCIQDMMLQENKYIHLYELAYSANKVNSFFQNGGFNDACEFFEVIIDNYNNISSESVRSEIAHLLRNFQITIKQELIYSNCENIPMNEPIYGVNFLKVAPVNGEQTTIQDSLELYDDLKHASNYICTLCNTRDTTYTKSTIWETNKYCVFRLVEDDDSIIYYPSEFYWKKQNKKLFLFAVLCKTPGHWWSYTYVKDKWWKCDDLEITSTDEDTVLNEQFASVVFYEMTSEESTDEI